MATLDSVQRQMSEKCAPIWFHLSRILLTTNDGHHLSDKDSSILADILTQFESSPSNQAKSSVPVKKNEVSETLKQASAILELLQAGPVGEFPSRLRLLAYFRDAIAVWPNTPDHVRKVGHRMVSNIVWFYSQFLSPVSRYIKEARLPIQREMSQFVRLMRWGDYANFWAIKANVNRAKKTMHKLTKSWETILQRPVGPIFDDVMLRSDQIWWQKSEDYLSSSLGPLPKNEVKRAFVDESFPLTCDDDQDALDIKMKTQEPLYCCKWTPGFGLPEKIHIELTNAGMISEHIAGLLASLKDQGQDRIRLPQIFRCMSRHTLRLSPFTSSSEQPALSFSRPPPLVTWALQVESGLCLWRNTVADLARSTRLLDLRGSRFPARLLHSVISGSYKGQTKIQAEVEDENFTKATVKAWQAEVTALQQRKRMALTDCCKRLASVESGVVPFLKKFGKIQDLPLDKLVAQP
ncbi:unnamed protein product [Protopolystoma xenopodis]|uniref:Uncharacterized protein n=1 Tax=Protopolystoma xenopodis TaxID=117903 RepID=A0A448WJB9_9PLAT|nr:unnamed protein product [Protopolystoma xenopodis]